VCVCDSDLEQLTAVWPGTIYCIEISSTIFVLNAELCQHLLTTAVSLLIDYVNYVLNSTVNSRYPRVLCSQVHSFAQNKV
jgi:hypothetical protein